MRNLGPKSRAWLAGIGIETLAQLRALGPFDAYQRLLRSGVPANLNLVYALVGAVEDRDWRAVQREDRTAILLRLDDLGLAP